jgi:hypothetical protein
MRPVWRPPVVVSCPRRPSPAQGLIKARGNPAMRRGNLVKKGTWGRRRSCLVPCASESGKEEACEQENPKLWGRGETGRSMDWSGRRNRIPDVTLGDVGSLTGGRWTRSHLSAPRGYVRRSSRVGDGARNADAMEGERVWCRESRERGTCASTGFDGYE